MCAQLAIIKSMRVGIVMLMSVFFFFFFSSRRRHTRFDCDWSSDVCSSDLPGFYDPAYPMSPKRPIKPEEITLNRDLAAIELWPKEKIADRHHIFLPPIIWRD